MIRVIVNGALGRMGRTVCDAVLAEEDLELVAMIDPAFNKEGSHGDPGATGIPGFSSLSVCLEQVKADVAVDFTIPDAVLTNVIACLKAEIHCVVGTTGLGEEQLLEIESQARSSGANCLIAPNFAIGAVLMMEVSRMIARHMPSCEIIELHHDQKLDAPSGTALRTADLIAREFESGAPSPAGPEGNAARGFHQGGIPIHSVRLPGLVAHQEVIFGGQGQTLSVRHDSISRESFMPGVVLAVRRVADLDGIAVGLEKVM
ncbi:MAG: 4-hydroxy-tetrahydrodipicolinate reductase [Thermoleophilia bacterium]